MSDTDVRDMAPVIRLEKMLCRLDWHSLYVISQRIFGRNLEVLFPTNTIRSCAAEMAAHASRLGMIADVEDLLSRLATGWSRSVFLWRSDRDHILWNGDIGPETASTVWDEHCSLTQFFIHPSYASLSPRLQQVLARLIYHAQTKRKVFLVTDQSNWVSEIKNIFEYAAIKCNGFSLAHFSDAPPTRGTRMKEQHLADMLECSMDRWCINQIDLMVTEAFNGDDAHPFGNAHKDIQRLVQDLWTQWHPKLNAEGDEGLRLRRHFLWMMLSVDDVSGATEGAFSQGPETLKEMLTGTLMALIVAACTDNTWEVASQAPGQFSYDQFKAHACGADWLGRRPFKLPLLRGKVNWCSDMVLLANCEKADPNYTGGYRVHDDGPYQPLQIPCDGEFLEALEDGVDAVKRHVERLEGGRRVRLLEQGRRLAKLAKRG